MDDCEDCTALGAELCCTCAQLVLQLHDEAEPAPPARIPEQAGRGAG